MYDPADTPLEIYVHASTLSTVGAAMPKEQNRRLTKITEGLDNNTHLRLPPSSLRDLGGVMAGKTKQPTLPASYYPAPHDYTLPSMLNSNTARFSTSNLPSVLDQYVIQRRHNPGPKYLLDQYRKNRNISMGQATRPIFRRNAGSDSPGPNSYNTIPTSTTNAGVKFGKLPIERPPLENYPGPNHYQVNNYEIKGGVKISDANLPSEYDYLINRNFPGPAKYTLPAFGTGVVGVSKFSTSVVPTDLDRTISNSQQIPSSSEYHSKYLIDHGRRTTGSGKFSLSSAPSFTDHAIRRAKYTPAPSTYNIDATVSLAASLKRDLRGRFSEANPKSVIDQVIARANDVPGAGEYSLAPAAKDYTMKKSQSSAFVMKTRTERFPEKRSDPSIIKHPLYGWGKSVPDRPGNYKAPSFTMGERFYTEEKIDRSIHSPTRITIPDAFGNQIRSDRLSTHGFSFGGQDSNDDDIIDSPIKRADVGPGEYDAFESFMNTYGRRKDWSGTEAVKQAKLKKARISMWKWRRLNNFN